MKHALWAVTLTGILASNSASAMDSDAVMDQLKAMQQQMSSMQKEIARLQGELAKTKAQAASAEKTAEKIKDQASPKAPEKDIKISMDPAPKFETADGRHSFKVGGFAQIDAGMFSDDRRDQPNGTNVRRARLNASGSMDRDWKYKLEYDFSPNTAALTDVYLEYAGFDRVSVMAGHFKEPFGLETLTSDLFTSFIERASTTAFSPDRNLGVMVSTYGNGSPVGAWTLSGGVFGGGVTTSSSDDESLDFTARATVAPIADGARVLHLGVAGSHRIPDSAAVTGVGTDVMTIASRPESRLTTAQQVSTGMMAGIDNINLLGLEAAAVYGPFSLQSEYVNADVNRRTGFMDETFSGYYAEASYFLTGESRNYSAKQGKFDRTKPKWALNPSQNQWGAWQVAARYSDLDLTGKAVRGGEMRNWTFGLRWLPTAHTLVSANYIRVNTDGSATTAGIIADDDPDIWMLRTQFDF